MLQGNGKIGAEALSPPSLSLVVPAARWRQKRPLQYILHEKHRCTQSSNMAKASLTRGGGVFLDRCTSLQKLPHCLRRSKATCGSMDPTASNCLSNLQASDRFWATNFAQNTRSPMGAPKISKWGTLDCFISSGKVLRSLKLYNSHLADVASLRSFLGSILLLLLLYNYGCWGAEAQSTISRLASRLAIQLQYSKSKAITTIYQRLNLTLVRANARALRSSSGLFRSEGGV